MREILAAQIHSTAIQASPENYIAACLKVHAPLDFDFPLVSAPGDMTTGSTYVEVDDGQRPLELIDWTLPNGMPENSDEQYFQASVPEQRCG